MVFDREVDLVDFEDVQILLFKDDNLYNLEISEKRKGRSVLDWQRRLETEGFVPSALNLVSVSSVQSARYTLSLVAVHLWKLGIPFSILDIGAFVGDFSLRMGNLARTFGQSTPIHAFDPTEAGSLIPFNIALNRLGDIVRHENVAISDVDGVLVLNATRGMSDATATPSKGKHHFSIGTLLEFFAKTQRKGAFLQKLAGYLVPKKKHSLVVPSVQLETWFAQQQMKGSIFAKVDIEGLDALVMKSLRTLTLGAHLVSVTEFNPFSFDSLETAGDWLREWNKDFMIFDIWYSPNPCFCRHISLEQGTEDFIHEIAWKRIFNYTDLLLLPRSLPELNALTERLVSLQEEKLEYIL